MEPQPLDCPSCKNKFHAVPFAGMTSVYCHYCHGKIGLLK